MARMMAVKEVRICGSVEWWIGGLVRGELVMVDWCLLIPPKKSHKNWDGVTP